MLEDCFVVRGPLPFAAAPIQEWHVHEAVFGVDAQGDKPWTMAGAEIEVAGLTKWSRWFPYDPTETRAPSVAYPLWSVGDCAVDLVQRVRTQAVSDSQMVIDAPLVLRIQGVELAPSTLHEIALRPVQALLALATGKYAAVLRQSIALPDGNKSATRLYERRTQSLSGTLDPQRDGFGFLYKDLQQAGVLQHAFEALRELHLIVDLYVAVLREPGYAELRFNLVAQALESLHRMSNATTPLPQDLWLRLLTEYRRAHNAQAELSAETPALAEAYALIGRKLSQLNQITFRDRLQALLQEIREAHAVCGNSPELFLSAVVQTRNFYVHWDEKPGSRVVRGADAVSLTSRMLALLELCLLNRIGLAGNARAREHVLHRRVSWL